MIHPYLEPLIREFEKNANSEYAFQMKRYMKGHFEFYGIRSPRRKEISRDFFMVTGLPSESDLEGIVRYCWDAEQRELQQFSIDMLRKYLRKSDKVGLDLVEFMILNKSWWDTVDGIASWIVGYLFRKNPYLIVPVTGKWMKSDNVWLQRTCLLFQLGYKEGTDLELMFGFINELKGSKVFWLQKAIGWVLREYSKTDPGLVEEFVRSNDLAPLSRREALRVIERKRKN